MGTFDLAAPQTSRRLASGIVFSFLALGAWSATLGWMGNATMPGRFTVGSIGFFVVLWVLMMAAMMFPSVWPAVAVYGLVIRRRASAGGRTIGRSSAFVGGYLVAWASFGLVGFGLLFVARTAGLDALSDDELAGYVVAPIALAAALYQAVPFKKACLRHCRGPLSFFLEHWRDGARGAFVLGGRHGAYCVGCCWMLVLVLLALGVMNVTWMAIVSLAIAAEKLAPPRSSRVASGLLTAGLVALALVALVKPSWLPGMGRMGNAGSVDDDPTTMK